MIGKTIGLPEIDTTRGCALSATAVYQTKVSATIRTTMRDEVS